MCLVELTAAQLRDDLAAGRVSACEIAQCFLDRIRQVDGRVGAFLRVEPDLVLAQARASDERRAAGRRRSALDGIPVALKDVLCTAGEPTTCSSRMLARFVPPYDATVVRRLRDAGLVLLGKTNLDEFAMGASTEHGALGRTSNPWDLRRVPGGSSGGSAAAVAARMAAWAIGTDTGGSVRQPAAFCGAVGLKPTYGRVSRYGLISFASSLDQVGPLARTAEDAALLLEVIAGRDAQDATSADLPADAFSRSIREPLGTLELGVLREQFDAGLDAETGAAVERAIDLFRTLGARVRDVSLPHGRYAVAAHHLIASCEASSSLARYDGAHFGYRADDEPLPQELVDAARAGGSADEADHALSRMYRQTRGEGFGPEVKRRIMLGTYALSAGHYDTYYRKALQVRRLIRGDFDAAFRQVDLLVGPTTPAPAFCRGEKLDDPLSMHLEQRYTVTANLAGIPGLSVPCGFTRSGLPIGLQLLAPRFQEARLLRAAHHYQQQTDWHRRRPELS